MKILTKKKSTDRKNPGNPIVFHAKRVEEGEEIKVYEHTDAWRYSYDVYRNGKRIQSQAGSFLDGPVVKRRVNKLLDQAKEDGRPFTVVKNDLTSWWAPKSNPKRTESRVEKKGKHKRKKGTKGTLSPYARRRPGGGRRSNPSDLEGPFTFPSGRVVYYDPGEGKYYDRSTDLYLSESEVESMQGKPKGRAKKNPASTPGIPESIGIWKLIKGHRGAPRYRSAREIPGFELMIHLAPSNRSGAPIFDLIYEGRTRESKTWKTVSPKSDTQAVEAAAKWGARLARKAVSGSAVLNPKKKLAKKKVAKKPARKKTPEWQLLCNRCAKLWDHYCERPSKTRLKPVLEHLEKMKASTSKRVADERKSCLRVANKEARRLKMK